MKEHDDRPELFESIRKLMESSPDFRPEQLTGRLFEVRLVEEVKFWCDIGHPDKPIMDRLAIWVKCRQDRELTAFLTDLAGRESVRQMIIKLERNYHKNTSPPVPNQ